VLDDVHAAPVRDDHGNRRRPDGGRPAINGVRLNRAGCGATERRASARSAARNRRDPRARPAHVGCAPCGKPLAADPGYRRIVLLAAAFIVWTLGEFWLNADPGCALWTISFLNRLVIALAIWSTLWAIGSDYFSIASISGRMCAWC
jgi:hypothetical protein